MPTTCRHTNLESMTVAKRAIKSFDSSEVAEIFDEIQEQIEYTDIHSGKKDTAWKLSFHFQGHYSC